MPAQLAEFRRNTGLILLWKSEIEPGPFCRECGIAAFRSTTNHCLMAGWWAIFAIFGNLYAITRNLLNRRKIMILHPTPGSGPEREGPPLLRRAGIYIAAALAVFFSFSVYRGVTTSRSELYDGECVQLETDRIQQVSCSTPHDARVNGVVRTGGDDLCPAETDEVVLLAVDEEHALCLDFDQ